MLVYIALLFLLFASLYFAIGKKPSKESPPKNPEEPKMKQDVIDEKIDNPS